MNNKNKILVGCLALLLVLSVGYAIFSDTITINGTATAKGEFSLTTTCDMDVPAIIGGELGESGSVTDAVITCEDNVVNASATLGYPGSEKWFRVMVTNTGTIPAKISKIVELNNPEEMIFEKDNGFVLPYFENCQGTSEVNYACAAFYLGVEVHSDFESESGGLESDWNQLEITDPTLDPGETAYFYIQMRWLTSSTTPGEALTPTLNTEITWEQVTG